MSLPEAFEQKFRQCRSDKEWTLFLSSMEETPPVSVRIHPVKYKKEFPKERIPWSTFGYYLEERPVFTLDPDFHSGSYYVQEASSQSIDFILRHVTEGQKNIKILDLCGAPGGKSTLAATFLSSEGLLVTNEVIRNRAYTLRQNMIKEGYDNVVVCHNDPADFARLGAFFDIIIVDAPCSGEGMFRKDPNSIGEWSPEHLTLCSARQKRIIQDVLPSLEECGYLIYSTCTYNDEENIRNIEEYITQHHLESLPVPFDPEWQITPVEGQDNAKGYQFFPFKTRGEGFFVSLLRKPGSETNNITYPKSFKNLVKASQKDLNSLLNFVNAGDTSLWTDKVNTFRSLPVHLEQDILFLADRLRVIHCGVAWGTWQKNIFIPDHSLAQSLMVTPRFPAVELSLQDALLFLKRELHEVNSDHKGWHLATFRGNGLGFFKNLGHRINNYLPQEIRIRMDIGSASAL